MKVNGEKKFGYESGYSETTKYNTLGGKGSGYTHENTNNSVYTTSESTKFNTIGHGNKNSYLGGNFDGNEDKYNSKMNGGFDTSPQVTQSSAFLGVEDTPTPTSSIETEDSATREVGERDVEGDGEQSD